MLEHVDDVLGRRIGTMTVSYEETELDGRNLVDGEYLCREVFAGKMAWHKSKVPDRTGR